MKRWKWIAYLFASLLILTVVSAKIVRAEVAYRLGKSYRFPVQAYDPRDPFRGRYLALQMESVARSSDIPGGRTSGPLSCRVSIVVDEKGKARFDHLSSEPPESGDWLTISPASGKGNTSVAFTAEANESTSEKEAEVNFYLEEELVHTMTVIQAGSTPYLTVSPTQVATLPVEGGDVELAVETNTSGWEYAITGSSSWLTEKSREENKLVLTAPVNEGAAKLEATVTISSKDDPTLKQEIAVAQYSLTADLLDVEFHNDGTATDLSPMHNQVEYVPGSALMTYHSESYDRYIAHFNQTPGTNMSSSYYKVDYSANSAFQNALSDGHTLEALVMFDAESDGSKEIKPFSSMQSGGTGFLITTTAQGNCLTFLPHVGGSYRWAKSNITPVRGRYYHLVGVYDKEAQKARIYVDGELKNEVDATGNLTLAGSGARWFCIGGDAASSYGEASWKGDIVLARIYDAPLSDGSVAMLWD